MTEITLEAAVTNIPAMIAFVDGELEKINCPMKAQMQIDIAVDEVFSNIAFYAYAPGTGDAKILFDYDEAAETVSIIFKDSGVPYNPLEKADPDVTLSAEERQIGGLGIFMVKNSMDEMLYEYRDGQNILTLRKRIR